MNVENKYGKKGQGKKKKLLENENYGTLAWNIEKCGLKNTSAVSALMRWVGSTMQQKALKKLFHIYL